LNKEPRHYATIVAMRRAYQERLIALLEFGVAAGELEIRDAGITAYAILAMLTGACVWYKPECRLNKAEVVELHTENGAAWLRAALATCCRAQEDQTCG
jgi:hypothetical protein